MIIYLFIYIHGCQFVLLYIWMNFLFKIKFYALKKIFIYDSSASYI